MRSPNWDGDAIRAELANDLRMSELYMTKQRARIRDFDARASEDLHDEALGESYFARLISTSTYCDSPDKLLKLLSELKPTNIQFSGAFDEKAARRAFRRKLRELKERAEAAIP